MIGLVLLMLELEVVNKDDEMHGGSSPLHLTLGHDLGLFILLIVSISTTSRSHINDSHP